MTEPAGQPAPQPEEKQPEEQPAEEALAEEALAGLVADRAGGDPWAVATDSIGTGSTGTGGTGTGKVPAPRPRDPAPRPVSRQAPPDIFGDMQRWLIKAGARSVRREVQDQLRRAIGGGRPQEDVWGRATTEPPPHTGESPECQWCPICRAARAMRESGPGLGPQLTGASGAVASAVQDAITAVDGIISRSAAPPRQPEDRPEGTADEPGDRR